RMIEPLPQVFSICVMARLSALRRSSERLLVSGFSAAMVFLDMGTGPLSLRPEYTPKSGSAPAGAERVFQVLQLAVAQADGVEAVDVAGLPEAVHPGPRRPHQLAPLLAGDRFHRAAEPVAPARLHFHERHHAAAPRHDVDLDPPDPEAVGHHGPPLGPQIRDRLLFSSEPRSE